MFRNITSGINNLKYAKHEFGAVFQDFWPAVYVIFLFFYLEIAAVGDKV